MKIIDISVELNENTIIYPGDKAFSLSDNKELYSTGNHNGTHIDAPSHAISGGKTLEELDLEKFYGLCKVFDLSHLAPGNVIKKSDLKNLEINSGDRILVKTSNSERGYEEFYEDYVYLSGEAAKYMAEKGVILFGIDYLSVKQVGSKNNSSHEELLKEEIGILEGINLKDVDPGEYEISCLPIKMTGLDGGPTRAVLIKR